MLNGVTDLFITKPDVMNDFDEIKMCTSYEINGKLTDEIPFEFNAVEIEPQLVSHPGWKQSLEGIESAGGTEMTKSFAGIDYTFSVEQWYAMINAVENYAGACQQVTAGHRKAVEALTTVKKVEAYDYTVGYPAKINFDTMFQ